jgi:hypothetical protein
MTFVRLVPLWLLLIAACGEVGVEEGTFDICSDATDAERTAAWQVYDAFCELGYEPTCCVVFVHSPDYLMPSDVTWKEYCDVHPVDPRNLAEGFRGMYSARWHTAYVRTYGEAGPYLISLLIHELAHSVGFRHGESMKQFELRVKGRMQE